MTDNYDSGFDLVLSDDERQELVKYYNDECLPHYQTDSEEDLWYGIHIGDRVFDLNIWTDDMTGQQACAVYECEEVNGTMQTNCRHSWTLTEE